jgi:sensor domain CHASE-containing protein
VIRRFSTVLLPLLTVLLVMAAGFAAQSRITTSAFDRLEADQVEQDAQRVRIGLDSWVALLRNYGATNSIWDSSYADVASGDAAAFAGDFPPSDVKTIYGLDGVLGVDPGGRLRAGGLVHGTAYDPLPGRLAAPTTLARLFDPAAEAGDSRCGVVDAGSGPYLYCGFAAHRSDGTADRADGLVFLRALAGTGLTDLGRQLSMPVSLTTTPAA